VLKHRVSSHVRTTPNGNRIRVHSYVRGTETRRPLATIPKYFTSRLPAEMLIGRDVIQILHDAGYEGYVVGGATRDFIMGNPIHDVDITTNATPSEVTKLFQSKGYKAIPTGEEFGTITVLFNGSPIEITTYRSEGKYEDSRHPGSVKWETDVVKDLSRRDFTINAIAYDPIHDKFIDPFGGQKDIQNNVLRAVGDPHKRFREDPLRMMRFVRFAGRFGAKPDPRTVQAIKDENKLLTKIPAERVRDELLKSLETDGAGKSVRMMVDTGLMETVIPGLTRLDGMPQEKKYHKYDVLTHSIKTMEALPKERPILRLVGLIHDIEKPSQEHAELGEKRAEEIANNLKLSTPEKEYLKEMVGHHMDFFSYSKKIKPKDVRRYINRLGNKELVDDLVAFNIADIKGSGTPRTRVFGKEFNEALKEVRAKKEPTGVHSLKIRGGDIMELGFRGPEVGRVLKTLAEEVIEDPEKNTREYLLKRAKEL